MSIGGECGISVWMSWVGRSCAPLALVFDSFKEVGYRTCSKMSAVGVGDEGGGGGGNGKVV